MYEDHEITHLLTAEEREVLEAAAGSRGISPREALRTILREWTLLSRLSLLPGLTPLGVRWRLMLAASELHEAIAESLLKALQAPRPEELPPEEQVRLIREGLSGS